MPRNIVERYNLSENGPLLQVSVQEHLRGGPCAVVSLTGRAGINSCQWTRLFLELPAAQRGGRLVVDLSRLSWMDRWVALIMVWASAVVARRGGTMILVSPRPQVAQLLAATGAPGLVVADRAWTSGTSPGSADFSTADQTRRPA